MDALEPQAGPTTDLLARLWERNAPLLLERLNTLDAAAEAARKGSLDADLHARALAHAHNLAGSLGMFGYPRGTDLAREIEELLYASADPPSEQLSQLTKALRDTLYPAA